MSEQSPTSERTTAIDGPILGWLVLASDGWKLLRWKIELFQHVSLTVRS